VKELHGVLVLEIHAMLVVLVCMPLGELDFCHPFSFIVTLYY